jgi:alkanesulfonate monooxygenase SsuD/methylene tetrahydromethanopterin reductase-like flavin-dependent oxidoreductase (luciferase family)
VIGAPETVRQGLEDFVARTQVNEVIATANIFDHGARLRSFKLLSEVWPQVTAGQQRAA